MHNKIVVCQLQNKKEISFSEAIKHTERGDLINGNGTVNWMEELWKSEEEKLQIYKLNEEQISDQITLKEYEDPFTGSK